MMLIKGFIKININSLNLALTLKTGQNFRWKQLDTINNDFNDSTKWLGIINNLYVVQLIQQKDSIEYNVINTDFVLNYLNKTKNKTSVDMLQKKFDEILRNYFRLDIDLDNLYELWSECDENFKITCTKFKGIRLLRQDLIENIFSFICSSNNNIGRITKMIDKLCLKYGNELYSSKNDNQLVNSDVYSFPSIEKLSENQIENDLRKLGFGYRAKFIQNTAKHIMQVSQNKPDEWIQRLKLMSYEDARKELMSLPGIGAKVADCICLMSLEFTESIPVDTHVYKITLKFYLDDLNDNNKSAKSSSLSLTTKRYNEIGDFYRQKFKIHSGWAQTVLFCSDLKIK